MTKNKWLFGALALVLGVSLIFIFKGSKNDYNHQLKQAEAGNPISQYNVGIFLLNGTDGAAKNPEQAKKWLTKAAEQKHPLAPLVLGQMYRDGEGVSQSEKAAKAWENYAYSIDFEDVAQDWYIKGYISEDQWKEARQTKLKQKEFEKQSTLLLSEISELKGFETEAEHGELFHTLKNSNNNEDLVKYLTQYRNRLLERKQKV